MPESLEILKMRALICFLNEDPALCTVTGLADILGEGKQKISRLLMSLEKEGLLDRSDLRRPRLTQAGREQAAYYEKRTNIVLNHLLYEGLDLNDAEHDAYAWARFSSERGMEIIKSSEQRYRAKYELRRQKEFGGEELCRHLADGEYSFPFLIYRETVRGGTNLSMANEGFRHPCVLRVADGRGQIVLQPVDLSAKSPLTGRKMNGRVRKLTILQPDGVFMRAEEDGENLAFSADVLHFLNIGEGMGQILHGSVCMRMQCSVGTMHMRFLSVYFTPKSTAIFTIMI